MYSIINFSIILIRQKTKNKRHIAFTGKKKTPRPKEGAVHRQGCRKEDRRVQKENLISSEGCTEYNSGPREGENARPLFIPSKANGARIQGNNLSSTFQL